MIADLPSLASGWKWIALEELAAPQRNSFVDGPFGSDLKVSDLVAEGVPLIRIQHIGVAEFRPGFDQFISEHKFSDLSKHAVLPGDLVFAKLGEPAGRSTIIPSFVRRGLIVADCVRLRVDPTTIEPSFLGWVVNAPVVLQQIGGASKGSTRLRANLSDFKKIKVPVPKSRSEQRKIAGQLAQADRLRRTRRYALELSDSFLPAAFLELFGDPVANPRGWDRAKVSELGEVVTGSTPPRENAAYYGDAIEWIKSDNIGLAQVPPTKAAEGLSEKGLAVGTVVSAGSLLVTCIAGSETSIGNVVLTDRPVAFNQQINAVIPRPGVDAWFLYGLFLAAKPSIQRSTTLAMKRMITKGKLEELMFFKPPFLLQQKFAALVARHEHLRATQREALRQAEHLFQTLLHQAFSPAP